MHELTILARECWMSSNAIMMAQAVLNSYINGETDGGTAYNEIDALYDLALKLDKPEEAEVIKEVLASLEDWDVEDHEASLSANEYQKLAARTSNIEDYRKDVPEALKMVALGLTGESGEIANDVKKVYYHGHTISFDHLDEEMGDVLWYIAFYCSLRNITLSSIMEKNIEKLKKRYPQGFSAEASRNRVV
jgi:NTP pyrophosphatase (non-canonical NTP hydrolase)